MKISEYLGIEPEYTEEVMKTGNGKIQLPDLVGSIYEDAVNRAGQLGISLKVLGEGDTVAEQYPAGGSEMDQRSELILYLE